MLEVFELRYRETILLSICFRHISPWWTNCLYIQCVPYVESDTKSRDWIHAALNWRRSAAPTRNNLIIGPVDGHLFGVRMAAVSATIATVPASSQYS